MAQRGLARQGVRFDLNPNTALPGLTMPDGLHGMIGPHNELAPIFCWKECHAVQGRNDDVSGFSSA